MQNPDRRPAWTNRIKDGRLRVQCQACFDAGLVPQESVRDCSRCWDRARRKRSEMYAFREHIAKDPAPQTSHPAAEASQAS